MARKKEIKYTIRGRQLLARGDIIRIIYEGMPVKCKVLSCLATNEGDCFANLEILEGSQKGNKISTTLKMADEPFQEESL